LQAVCDLTPLDAVLASVAASDARFVKSWFADEVLLGIGGCSPLRDSPGMAAPWLLGTDDLSRYLCALTRLARRELVLMRAVYPHLSNVIDARQTQTLAWLRSLGFVTTDEPERKPGFKLARFVLGGW